jgi:hypothetical protein
MTTASVQSKSTSTRRRTASSAEPRTAPAKVTLRERIPADEVSKEILAVEVLKVSITTLRQKDQLKLLTEIADSEISSAIGKKLGRMEKHIGGDIRLVAKEQALNSTSLRSQQLLDVALSAAATGPLCDTARQSTFSKLRKQAPAVQRGQLHAMRIFQESRIAQGLPDVGADALCSLLTKSPPRSLCATELADLYNQRLDDFETKYRRRERALTKRFEALGTKEILKPALRAEYPNDAKRQRKELAKMRDGGTLYKVILTCCTKLRDLKQPVAPKVLAVVDELEHIHQALGQSIEVAVDLTATTMEKQLINMLRRQLPASVQAKLTGLLDKPESKARNARIEALLRTPMTSPDQLIDSLKSDGEVFEALQILWGGAPVYSLRFARNLSEMLLITNKQSELLQDVESKLLARLGPEKIGNYAMKCRRETRKAKPDDEPRSQLVVNSVMRVMNPPSKDKEVDRKLEKLVKMQTGRIKTSFSQDQLAIQRRQILEAADYAVTPEARPYEAMLAWLETKKSRTLKIEAAQRPPNPMPAPKLALQPKIVAPAAPQAIPVEAVPVPYVAPLPGTRVLKRRHIRPT